MCAYAGACVNNISDAKGEKDEITEEVFDKEKIKRKRPIIS